MQIDVGWVLALVINNVSPHGVLHGAYFLPEVVEISVESVVNLFVVVCARFTRVLFPQAIFTFSIHFGL